MFAAHQESKRVLIVSSLFPPEVLGGAEQSAYSFAKMFQRLGYEVGVLTTTGTPSAATRRTVIDGLLTWRVVMPRPYAMIDFPNAPARKKPFWHLQDHFDPRNASIVARILDEFRPDLVNIHLVQGLGYNALNEIAKRRLPVYFVLHDLGLACIRMNMFVGGRSCTKQCGACRLSSAYKQSILRRQTRVSFCSPSRANLERLGNFVPLSSYRTAVILNPNQYPPASVARSPSEVVRILYVGRLHKAKGIELLLQAAATLAPTYQFRLTIVGQGPEEAALRATYEANRWCSFAGFVTQSEISNYIANSDVICVPSVWEENSPGTLIHALSQGLPALGSNFGGIPELIEHGVTGQLVDATQSAWVDALGAVLRDRSVLDAWRANLSTRRTEFDITTISRKHDAFVRESCLEQESP
jgi:glycosyltransferase involved in cell wall biosynthesis